MFGQGWASLLLGLFLLAPATLAAADAHDFTFTSIDGQPLPLRTFAGQPVLVVNTASLCGFTYQYAGLQDLWETYRERGLVVLGVPSNDFGGQEPGTEDEIKNFCEVNFDVDFPMTEKQQVRGRGSHPFFAHVRATLGKDAGPSWNFHKYLIGPDGDVLGAWPSATEPDAAEITRLIEEVLSR